MTSPDLLRFRNALEDRQDQLEEASRPSRFKPPTDLTLVEIRFGTDSDPGTLQPLVGEILDISVDGMKIALNGAHPIDRNQSCRIIAAVPDAPGAAAYRLVGNVRWVDSHPLVTVFGIQFEAAH